MSLPRARQRRAAVGLGLAITLGSALGPSIAHAAPSEDAEPSEPAPEGETFDEAPAATADDPAPEGEAAASPDDAPATTDDAPATTDDAPATTDDAPATTDDAPATTDEDGAQAEGPEPEEEPEPEPEPEEDAEPIRPPRFDGPYIGLLAIGTTNFASVLNHDTPNPLFGTGGFLQAGDAVFPWMSIGISAGGQAAWVGDQQMFEGALLVEFGFVPARRYPLSIRAGFGFGGGTLTQAGIEERSGFGGAVFKGAARYEFFPLAEKKRKDRGGGWAIGPELGWLGATPAGKGQPFVNTILLGLSTSFYFGS